MMRHILLLFLCCCAAVGLLPGQAAALGLGAYVEGSAGQTDFTIDNDREDWELETDKRRSGFGFVMDTNLAQDSFFNYRLQVGVENWEEESEFDTKLDLSGISLTQDFGFGIVRTPSVRVWVGPELRLAAVTGSPDDNPDFDIYLFNYGVGPVLGANFNIGRTVTLAIKAGYLFEGYAGSGESSRRNSGSFIDPDGSIRDEENDILYAASSYQVFVNFAILFRIVDHY